LFWEQLDEVNRLLPQPGLLEKPCQRRFCDSAIERFFGSVWSEVKPFEFPSTEMVPRAGMQIFLDWGILIPPALKENVRFG
jgi:hypothetical protein